MAQLRNTMWGVGIVDHLVAMLGLPGRLAKFARHKPGAPGSRRYRDRSRYSGEMLRAIRAERGCGRPPRWLAARQTRPEAR